MAGSWGLDGEAAFITGVGGMGRAGALAFAEEGIPVAVTDVNLSIAETTAELVAEKGGSALPMQLDVTDSAQVQEVMAKATAELGSLDYLFNTAGIGHYGALAEMSNENWSRMVEVCLTGTFYTCRTLLPAMIARGRGAIVNISSMFGQTGQANMVHYSAAKAGVMGLTKALAREMAEHGIRVNSIAPGPIDTPLWRRGLEGQDLENLIEERRQPVPMKRVGHISEIADAMMYLMSPASSYVTGQILHVGGGEVTVT